MFISSINNIVSEFLLSLTIITNSTYLMNNEILFRWIAHTSLIIYICALILLLWNLRKLVRNNATQAIYATLFFWFILAAKDIAYFFDDNWYDPQVCNTLMSIDLWPTPIIAILLLNALQSRWINIFRISLMFVPFFIFTLLNIITKGNQTVFIASQIYGFVFATVVGVIIYILTYKCDIYLDANYSYKNHIGIKWVRRMTILMYFICSLWVLLSLLPSWLGDTIYYIATTVLTTLLFYFTLRHREVIFPDYMSIGKILSSKVDKESVGNESTPKPDNDSHLMNQHQFAKIEAKLQTAINEEKVYLNPQLTLADLANHIGTNRTYLSRYINNYMATPFINYINDYRCAEAKEMLSDTTSQLTLSEISEKCGFASYSTFRRVFKQKYGYAPSQCRK